MRAIRKFLFQYQGLLLCAALFVVSGAGILYGIVPATQRTIAMAKDVQTLRKETKVLAAKAQALGSVDEDFFLSQLRILSSAVPSDKSLPTLLLTVESVMAQTGVSIIDMTIANPGPLATAAATQLSAEEKQIGSFILPMAVSVYGSYEQIKQFTETMVSVRRLLRIKDFAITIQSGDNGTARFAVDGFYLPIKAAAIPATQPLSLTSEEEAVLSSLTNYPWLAEQSADIHAQTSTVVKSDPFSR